MRRSMKSDDRYPFFFLTAAGILTGVFLRLYRIDSQIIWDDEWHGLYTAFFNPMKYIFTHFHVLDNCIPLTAYYRIMLESVGLSEVSIRFPMLLSGILMLVISPLLIKKIYDKKAAVIFLFMLAISPLHIYFSRSARPYGIVVFLSFISILSFYLWMKDGKAVYASAYVVCAASAPYFSLSALAFVLAPIVYIIALIFIKRVFSLIDVGNIIPRLQHIIIVIFFLIAGIGAWLLPAVGTLGEIVKKNSQGFINPGTLGGCATLFCGSTYYVICILMLALFMFGSYVLYMSNKLLLSYLYFICILQLLFIAISRPFLVQASIVYTRYFISSLPVWLLIVAVALTDIHTRFNLFLQRKTKMAGVLSGFMIALLVLTFFLTGPVPEVYSFPNDFTNHQDFQYKYLNRGASLSEAHDSSYPEFYRYLRDQAKETSIIEFPAIISWAWNFYHVYQRFHGKRVKVGYDSDYYGPFFGYDSYKDKGMSFSNFVDISHPGRLSNAQADFVVLHKHLWKENVAVALRSPEEKRKMEEELSAKPESLFESMQEYVSTAVVKLESVFGEPFYEDDRIVVYKIK